jgi:hypothetical protein
LPHVIKTPYLLIFYPLKHTICQVLTNIRFY